MRSNSAHLWAPKKTGVMAPVLILSPVLRTPENAGVTSQFRPFVRSQEGRGDVVFEFAPFSGDPRECRGCVAIPPIWGPPRRQG